CGRAGLARRRPRHRRRDRARRRARPVAPRLCRRLPRALRDRRPRASGSARRARWPSSRRRSSRGTSSVPRAPRSGRKRAWYSEPMTPIPIQVYGINLLVKLMSEGPADVRIHCPKGSPIRYGEVVARGDGFDEGANAFREMPDLKAVVAFEESAEEVEGHYFYIAGEEYRV